MSEMDLELFEARQLKALQKKLARAGARPEQTLFSMREAALKLEISLPAMRALSARSSVITVMHCGEEMVPRSEIQLVQENRRRKSR